MKILKKFAASKHAKSSLQYKLCNEFLIKDFLETTATAVPLNPLTTVFKTLCPTYFPRKELLIRILLHTQFLISQGETFFIIKKMTQLLNEN